MLSIHQTKPLFNVISIFFPNVQNPKIVVIHIFSTSSPGVLPTVKSLSLLPFLFVPESHCNAMLHNVQLVILGNLIHVHHVATGSDEFIPVANQQTKLTVS